MKYSLWLVLIVSLISSNLTEVRADEPEEGKVSPMFKGEFKCSDGYDPDTDASLHPKGQDYRTRQLINEQERQKHEEQIQQNAEKNPEKKSDEQSGRGEKSTNAVPDAKAEELKDKNKDDKDKEKKDKEKEKDKDKEKSEKKDDESEKKDKKADEKDPKKEEAQKALEEQKNPLNQAIFAIHSRNYSDSLKYLNVVLAKQPKHQQAHYLMAVTYVGLRKYDEAREQYNIIIKSNLDPKLVQMANLGLAKIPTSTK
jgi:tetratricopeptide (TPR) repeat protein